MLYILAKCISTYSFIIIHCFIAGRENFYLFNKYLGIKYLTEITDFFFECIFGNVIYGFSEE